MCCDKRCGTRGLETDIDIALFGRFVSGEGTEETEFRYAVLFGESVLILSEDLQNVFTGPHGFYRCQ